MFSCTLFDDLVWLTFAWKMSDNAKSGKFWYFPRGVNLRIPSQDYTNGKNYLWFLLSNMRVIRWHTKVDHCLIPFIIYNNGKFFGVKKDPKSWMCVYFLDPAWGLIIAIVPLCSILSTVALLSFCTQLSYVPTSDVWLRNIKSLINWQAAYYRYWFIDVLNIFLKYT